MTHFRLVVAIDDPDALPAALEPFDENLEVPPYRAYFEVDVNETVAIRGVRGGRGSFRTTRMSTTSCPRRTPRRSGTGGSLAGATEVSSSSPALSLRICLRSWNVTGSWAGPSTEHPSDSWIWRVGDRRPPRGPGVSGTPSTSYVLRTRRARGGPPSVHTTGPTPPDIPWPERGPTTAINRSSGRAGSSPVRYRGCPIDAYGSDRRSHTRRAHDHGVLGYALLPSEGEWIAPGEMGGSPAPMTTRTTGTPTRGKPTPTSTTSAVIRS